jgi:hypothetical protein
MSKPTELFNFDYYHFDLGDIQPLSIAHTRSH